jgi:hypothetical protein
MAIYRQSSREDRYGSTSGTVGQNGLVRIDNGVPFVVFQSEVHNAERAYNNADDLGVSSCPQAVPSHQEFIVSASSSPQPAHAFCPVRTVRYQLRLQKVQMLA